MTADVVAMLAIPCEATRFTTALDALESAYGPLVVVAGHDGVPEGMVALRRRSVTVNVASGLDPARVANQVRELIKGARVRIGDQDESAENVNEVGRFEFLGSIEPVNECLCGCGESHGDSSSRCCEGAGTPGERTVEDAADSSVGEALGGVGTLGPTPPGGPWWLVDLDSIPGDLDMITLGHLRTLVATLRENAG